jgi:hypothetical protein
MQFELCKKVNALQFWLLTQEQGKCKNVDMNSTLPSCLIGIFKLYQEMQNRSIIGRMLHRLSKTCNKKIKSTARERDLERKSRMKRVTNFGEQEMKATPKLLKKWELRLYNWDKQQDQDTRDSIYSLAFFIILTIISILIWGIYFIL